MDFHASRFSFSGNINITCIPQAVVVTSTSDENVVDDNKQRGDINDALFKSPQNKKHPK